MIEEIKEIGAKIICKNNKPECAIVSFEKYASMVEDLKKYQELIESQEDEKILLLAKERLKTIDNEETVSREELMMKYKIYESDLEDIEVEFE